MKYGIENPNSIYLWNKETFRQPDKAIINRATQEVVELLIAVLFEHDTSKVEEELADVAIMLWASAVACTVDARPAIPEEDLGRHSKVNLITMLNFNWGRFVYFTNRSSKGKSGNFYLHRSLELLENLVHILNVDIAALVDNKMVINRQRRWAKNGGNNFQHVA